MIWLVKFLQKRPSDKTIMIWRIIFWIILWWSAYYSLIYWTWEFQDSVFWLEISWNVSLFLKYFLVLLWIIPILVWASNVCLLKSKYVRIWQIIFAIVLFFFSAIIKETANLWIDTLLWIMWLFPLFAWITWKCITTKCLRYWQKITKIRV